MTSGKRTRSRRCSLPMTLRESRPFNWYGLAFLGLCAGSAAVTVWVLWLAYRAVAAALLWAFS